MPNEKGAALRDLPPPCENKRAHLRRHNPNDEIVEKRRGCRLALDGLLRDEHQSSYTKSKTG